MCTTEPAGARPPTESCTRLTEIVSSGTIRMCAVVPSDALILSPSVATCPEEHADQSPNWSTVTVCLVTSDPLLFFHVSVKLVLGDAAPETHVSPMTTLNVGGVDDASAAPGAAMVAISTAPSVSIPPSIRRGL